MSVLILPYEGVDSARLNASREEVRKTIPSEVRAYKKGCADADQFLGASIHAYYDDRGHCSAFEIYAPQSVDFFGHELLGRPFREVLELLRQWADDVKMQGAGALSVKLGVSLYAPDGDEPESLVKGVLVFRRGYWEEPINPRLKAKFDQIQKSLEERLGRKKLADSDE